MPVFAVNIDSRLEARRRHHVPLMNPELIRHMDKHSAASSGTETAIVANCASIPHDPTEIERLDPASPKIPYDWGIRHG